MEAKPSISEVQRQGQHFRRLQNWSFIAVNAHLISALAMVALAIYFLPKEKYDQVREVIGMIIGYVFSEWKNAQSYSFGTSAGSAKANETLRQVVQSTNPVGETEGK